MAAAPVIGLVVPPAQGQVPQDGPTLYGERYRFVARGLGIGGVSPEGFAPVVDRIVERAVELREAGAEVISMMGTSISFYRGPDFTESLRRAMEEATGVPCTTMSHGVVRALRHLGVTRVAVATSYIDELNAKLAAHLAHAGITVTAIEGLSITAVKEVGEVSTQALVELGRRVFTQDRSAEGIFISCGGLLTLDAIRQLEDELGVPATASSPAGFWDVVRLAGGDPSSPGFGRLFEAG
ncbi:arylmalonate decarboxylase [Ramlibacter sp. AW1]|uniref:Arylmalonate decarboxylase n=1 Tax=Ramlibacter aurantiacus TaxID=2801330 RepID=A0A936ZZ03_9BURK|nr:aspartate/glutamate racemase family protein [Ramlibacter aurantiacus]MBL0423059.1 arylmalonate decarboxylase [Ramlibacter aurantiacus]